MTNWLAGFARKDVTVWEPDMQIWGWFMPENRIDGAETPLYARACVLRTKGQSIAYVCVDVGYISVALRRVVLNVLKMKHPKRGFGPHNVMLTATHTHSGPSGYSDVVGQNSANYGFSPKVMTTLAEGIVGAILEAEQRLESATLRLGHVDIPFSEPVAFNRSVDAFRRNPDVHWVPEDRPEVATYRRSTTLRVEDKAGRILGIINWFGVHATCVHAENTKLHSDNKGLAAVMFERSERSSPAGRPDCVALFAQESAGDVSPNFRYDAQRDKVVGTTNDDFEHARDNAEIQFRYAMYGAEKAKRTHPLKGSLTGSVIHVDMADSSVAPQWAGGATGRRTTHATWGMLMPTGTAEGPGPMRPILPLLRTWMKWRRLRTRMPFLEIQDIKVPFLELGLGTTGRFLGCMPTNKSLGLVGMFDPVIGYIHALYADSLLTDEPWLPRVLPVQYIQVGRLGILGLPGELTTVAGARLRKACVQLKADESTEWVINSYANGYAGYVATPEEYQQQEYEGAYTTFGPWTWGAYATHVHSLLQQESTPDPERPIWGPAPLTCSYDTLLQRRKVGRKGTWGRGSYTHIPLPESSFFTSVQDALNLEL